jgi:hypothetical protein
MQIVVQRALSVAVEMLPHRFYKERVLLVAGYFNPFSRREILSAFPGLSGENREGWSPCVRQLYREISRQTTMTENTNIKITTIYSIYFHFSR